MSDDAMIEWFVILAATGLGCVALYGAAVAVAWILARFSRRFARLLAALTDNF